MNLLKQDTVVPRARLEVSTVALRENIARLRDYSPGSKISGVVKANAYGHDLSLIVATIKDQVDGFSVATIKEGIELRSVAQHHPVWVLSGCLFEEEVNAAQRFNLTPVVCDADQLKLVTRICPDIQIGLKIDTGLGRFGFDVASIERLLTDPKVFCRVTVLLSHFADADNLDSVQTRDQLQRFSSLDKFGSLNKSLAASAGILSWPNSHYDWVRPGLAMYGVSPFPGTCADAFGLKAVMTFKSVIVSVRMLKKGQKVGYSGTWVCPENMRVAIVGCGYGDGYPRFLDPSAHVLIGGQRAPIIGVVSMDTITVDARRLRNCQVGQEVTLWGEGIPVETVASTASTIPNELLTRVHNRVPAQISLPG